MKNVEKYSTEITGIYSSGYKVAINKNTNEPVKMLYWMYYMCRMLIK